MTSIATVPDRAARHARLPRAVTVTLAVGALAVLALLIWQAFATAGVPDPTLPQTTARVATLDIAVLVFREGLECILVLAAITAGMSGRQRNYREPIAWGAVGGAAATIATWFIAIRAIDALTERISALAIQAATGLLAVVVLLVVMNWFFHRIYWTGWIGAHNRRKRDLIDSSADNTRSTRRIMLGLAALGFTSLYREGFEIVLFLQTYRLKLGGEVVLGGVLVGVALAAVVGALTFVGRRKLPYKQMLVVTGALLGVVLLVMVGEQAQEMQLAHWLPTTPVPSLEGRIPAWTGLWFSVFPTLETLLAQGVAAGLVIGSYVAARARVVRG